MLAEQKQISETRDARFVREAGVDYRSAAQVDRDRVQYSSAFARLGEVTQVVSAAKGYAYHNRLTHTLKVAQLARRLGEKLNKEQPEIASQLHGLDPDAAEAAALAHDIGHPPFGHLAEETLDGLCKSSGLRDGYEGNAQSFRIVTRIATGDGFTSTGVPVTGLNLTRATLNALLKYPWIHGDNPENAKKWGSYESERPIFEWVREQQPFGKNVKCIEAELMDWADDITYSVHDLIDFYCAGRIPLERLAENSDANEDREAFFEEVFQRKQDLQSRRDGLMGAFQDITKYFPLRQRYLGTGKQKAWLWRYTTVLISRYVDAVKLSLDRPDRCVEIPGWARDEIAMLKQLTWHYVILHNDLALEQHGYREMIKTTFDVLKHASQKELKLFPPYLKEQLQQTETETGRIRLITDHISSMTEKEIMRFHRAVTGRH